MVKTMKAKYPLVSDIHLTNTLIDAMVTFLMSPSQMADKETLGEGMSFLLFGVIHAATRSVAQLGERLQESRGSNNTTVEEERKYRKAGVSLPPMQFHAMKKEITPMRHGVKCGWRNETNSWQIYGYFSPHD